MLMAEFETELGIVRFSANILDRASQRHLAAAKELVRHGKYL